MHRGLRQPFFLLLGGFFLTVSLCAVVIWQISADARRQIDVLATANTDSVQWSLAQAEVEMLLMLSAASDAAQAPPEALPPALDALRQRIDIFYSRISTLTGSPVFGTLRTHPGSREALTEAQDYLDRWIPVIDGPDAALAAALPELLAETEALRPALRQSALEGVRVFAEKSDQQRNELARALSDLGAIAALLFLGLMIAVIALAVLSRILGLQAARNAATRNRLQAVISTSIDAILVAGTDGRILDFNAAASRMYGYSAKEAIGRDLFELIIPQDKRHRLGQLLRRVQERPYVPVQVEVMQSSARRRSGELFPIEFSISGAESADGPVVVAFVRDISRRVSEKAELIEARDRAVAGERAKARMLAVMSHEIRTPLNGVLGTLDLLGDTALDETQRHYVEVMEQSGRMLLAHVNDVLDISRADAGNIQIMTEEFDPAETVSNLLEGLRAAAEQRGNQLALTLLGEGRGPVIGDRGRLSQVLMNLIGNAIKFTQNGRITVEIDRSLADGGIEFRVIDSGIGIPAEDLDRIFDEFVTLDSSYDRSVEGTGLGLGIVRRLVLLMGGQISVDSTPGQGSTFRVRLHLPAARPRSELGAELSPDIPGAVPPRAAPVLPTPQSTPQTTSQAALQSGPRPTPPAAGPTDQPAAPEVLVVEDNATNRLVVREMLKRRGCRVAEARDGHEGVSLADGQRFDLILMDISMPRMDGLSATRRIRGHGPNQNTPIVALTAHALPEDLARFDAAGMNGTLIKPLGFEALDKVLIGLGRQSADDPEADGPDAPGPGGKGPDEGGDPLAGPPDVAPDLHVAEAQARLAEALGPERAQTVLHGILAELEQGLALLVVMAGQPDSQPAEHEALAALAHRMAGSAALIGLEQMHAGLAALEDDARRAAGPQLEGARLHHRIAALKKLMPAPEAWRRAP